MEPLLVVSSLLIVLLFLELALILKSFHLLEYDSSGCEIGTFLPLIGQIKCLLSHNNGDAREEYGFSKF